MHSSATSVAAYIESFEGETRAVLEGIRKIAQEEIPGFEESMKYRMPTYDREEEYFAFAVQKHYLSVYVNDEALISRHAETIGEHGRGKCCIRYAKPDRVDLEGLRKLVREAYGG